MEEVKKILNRVRRKLLFEGLVNNLFQFLSIGLIISLILGFISKFFFIENLVIIISLILTFSIICSVFYSFYKKQREYVMN